MFAENMHENENNGPGVRINVNFDLYEYVLMFRLDLCRLRYGRTVFGNAITLNIL